MLGEGDRHGKSKKEQQAEELAPGPLQSGKREQPGPELERHDGNVLVELRHVYAGQVSVHDLHMLRAVRLEHRNEIHRRTRDRTLGEKLYCDEKSGAECPRDKGNRGLAKPFGLKGRYGTGGRKDCEHGGEHQRRFQRRVIRFRRPDRAQRRIGPDCGERNHRGVWPQELAPTKTPAEPSDDQNKSNNQKKEGCETRRHCRSHWRKKEDDRNEHAGAKRRSILIVGALRHANVLPGYQLRACRLSGATTPARQIAAASSDEVQHRVRI